MLDHSCQTTEFQTREFQFVIRLSDQIKSGICCEQRKIGLSFIQIKSRTGLQSPLICFQSNKFIAACTALSIRNASTSSLTVFIDCSVFEDENLKLLTFHREQKSHVSTYLKLWLPRLKILSQDETSSPPPPSPPPPLTFSDQLSLNCFQHVYIFA